MKASPESRTIVPGGLSATIIARDEERDLPECIASLKGLADEIVVVVDARSADKTEMIARQAGASVVVREFDHYAGQKQAALDLASKRWVLSIDADERVSPELRDAVLAAMAEASDAVSGFDITFEVRFLGRHLRHGGLGSERHLRLFRRESARFTGDLLHEGVVILGRVEPLPSGVIVHQPYHDLADYLLKLDRYTTLAARKRFLMGRRFHWRHHLRLPGEFFTRAVLKLGFLDGQPGLVWAGLSAFHTWLKYVKLREMEENPR